MVAPSIYFDPPYDIHLLQGQSLQIVNVMQPFISLLTIDGLSANRYVDSNQDTGYTFWTSFKEEKANSFGFLLENPVATNAGFERKPDWRITVLDEPADEKNRIRNFHLFAKVENLKDHSSNWTAIRIHIHNVFEEVWLTPNPLTVYPGIHLQNRVYGRFDDDAVACRNR